MQEESLKIRCPGEIELCWLNDWQYYADLDWTQPALIQLEVGWGVGGAEVIARLLGFGIRIKVATNR